MSKRYEKIGTRRIEGEYINSKCRALLQEKYFTHQGITDMERILKYFRDRKLPHLFKFNASQNNYFAAVKLPGILDDKGDPMIITATSKRPTTAVALCGVQLAELAQI